MEFKNSASLVGALVGGLCADGLFEVLRVVKVGGQGEELVAEEPDESLDLTDPLLDTSRGDRTQRAHAMMLASMACSAPNRFGREPAGLSIKLNI